MISSTRFPNRSSISLFSGCGGFDLGFQRFGFKTLWAADRDEEAVEAYNKNLESLAVAHDLTTELPSGITGLRPDIVFAGPPCQGFSTVGKRNPDDPRSHLLPEAGRLALKFDPKVIVIENVPGVRVGEPAHHWRALLELLRLSQYKTHDVLCEAKDLGLAQSRRRVLLFAWKNDREFPDLPAALPSGRLDEILAGVESQKNHRPQPLEQDSRLFQIATRIGPGQKLCNVRGGTRSVHTWHIPEVFGYTSAAECHVLETIMKLRRSERKRDFGDADPVEMERLQLECGHPVKALVKSLKSKGYVKDKGQGIDLTHSFNGKFRRLRWEDPACTVDTRFGDPHLFLHPNEHRPFTVREAARIQGFPDTFIFSDQGRHQFRFVGNAVPPPMGYFAAQIASKLI